MFTIAATIAAVLAALVALLAVPVVLVIDAKRVEKLEARWRIRWFFGLVDLRASRAESDGAPDGAADDEPPTPSPRKQRGRLWHIAFAVVRTRGLLQRVGRLLIATVRWVTLDRFHLEMMFGLDDPAETGFVYGCLSPFLVLADLRGLDVHCQPTFLDPGLRGVFQATIRLRPLLVVGTLVAFLLSPPVLRAAAAGWRARK